MLKEAIDGYTTIDGHVGALMTVQEFLDCCECGGFIDYDGHGDLVADGKIVTEPAPEYGGPGWVQPSTRHTIPDSVTHILWYNR